MFLALSTLCWIYMQLICESIQISFQKSSKNAKSSLKEIWINSQRIEKNQNNYEFSNWICSTVPGEGFDSSVIMPFSCCVVTATLPIYIRSTSSVKLHKYTFIVSRTFMAGAAGQAGDADSSWAPGLTSGLQGSVNVHRGALLLVPQWQCISSFVFYIFVILIPFVVWSR